jgi:hypothetical protein
MRLGHPVKLINGHPQRSPIHVVEAIEEYLAIAEHCVSTRPGLPQ